MINQEKKASWEYQYLSKEQLDGFNNYKVRFHFFLS